MVIESTTTGIRVELYHPDATVGRDLPIAACVAPCIAHLTAGPSPIGWVIYGKSFRPGVEVTPLVQAPGGELAGAGARLPPVGAGLRFVF